MIMMIMRSHTVSVGARQPQPPHGRPHMPESPQTASQSRAPTQRLDTTYRQLDIHDGKRSSCRAEFVWFVVPGEVLVVDSVGS